MHGKSLIIRALNTKAAQLFTPRVRFLITQIFIMIVTIITILLLFLLGSYLFLGNDYEATPEEKECCSINSPTMSLTECLEDRYYRE